MFKIGGYTAEPVLLKNCPDNRKRVGAIPMPTGYW